MELRTLAKEDKTLELEVEGEDDTVLNLIKEELLGDDNVSSATYTRRHPQLDTPRLRLTVVRGDPSNALKKALKSLRGTFDAFETDFLNATK